MFPSSGSKVLVGVVHAPRLVGEPGTDMTALMSRVAVDAEAYAAAGFDAVLVENYGDTPFPRDHSEPHVAAVMARLVATAAEASGLPVGCNVLRNDATSALAAALAGGGSFVRVNVLTGAVVTDQGVIEGRAHELMGYRSRIGAEHVRVMADVRVKHAAPLVTRPMAEEVDELVSRARADGLLVTGPSTGAAISLSEARDVVEAAGGRVPVWAASGCGAENIASVLAVVDGAVIGTAAKRDGVVTGPVDTTRATAIVEAASVVR